MADDGGDRRRPPARIPLKPLANNTLKWKDKLRENCFKRVRDDRNRVLWKMRLPESKHRYFNQKEFIKSTFQDIVSDEMRKIKESSSIECFKTSVSGRETDALWEYDGLHAAYEGECEEMLLEMQRIFYEDLEKEQIGKEPDSYAKTWEDEEDEYLARAVFEHMQLNDDKAHEVVWCPICKQGELQEDCRLIYCSRCEVKLNRGDEVTLDLLRDRLAEAHAEHLDKGCKSKPKFCLECRFGLTALYVECQGCGIFEIVI